MGHIRKRIGTNGDVSYVLIAEYGKGADGKRLQKQKTLRNVTRQQAEKALVEFQHEINTGRYLVRDNITFKELLFDWLEVQKSNLSPTTYKQYVNQCEKYICADRGIGHYKVQELNTLHIQRFVNQLSECSPISDKGLSPKSVRNIFNNIHTSLELGIDMGIIKENPSERVKLPKREKKEIQVLTEDEMNQLVFGIQNNSALRIPVLLALICGMRRGEILGIRFQDCQYSDNVICVRNNRVKGIDGIVDKNPKTNNSLREIVVPQEVMNLIKDKERFCKKKRLQEGCDYNSGNYVCFREKSGLPWTPDAFSNQYIRLVKKLGISKTSFHCLRHTFASYCVAKGVDVARVSHSLGHSQIGFTLNTYTHVMNKRDTLIPSVMEQALPKSAI